MSTSAPGPGELPPPAYSEQEYERKTPNAIELSLATSTQHQQEEEEWDEWDEAKFEAALRAQESSPRPTSNAGSNSSSVRALPSIPQPSASSASNTQSLTAPRVDEKKSTSKVPAQSVKPRPSWFDEAGLADSSTGSSSGSTYSRYTSSSNTGSSSSGFHPHHLMVHNFTPADEEEEDYAPPPFSPDNSSAPAAFGAIPVGDVITLSYNGRSNPNHISRLGPPPGTPPPSSRLVFPGTPEPAAPTPNPSSDRLLLRVEPLRPRASSNIHIPSYNIGPPVRMGFDPNVAYPKNGGLVEKQNAPPSPSTPIDVLSLYNSSVSAVLESSSQRFNRPQAARSMPSPGAQNTHFPSYFSPPVSPQPMYAPVTPPPLSNQNATQFPLQPSFTPDLSSYQYQSRWASSEQQFSHFR